MIVYDMKSEDVGCFTMNSEGEENLLIIQSTVRKNRIKSFKLTVFVFFLAPSDDGAISPSDELLHVVRRQAHGQ